MMDDPFTDSEKEKLLESLVSPIVEKRKQYTYSDLDNDDSDLLLPRKMDLTLYSSVFLLSQ